MSNNNIEIVKTNYFKIHYSMLYYCGIPLEPIGNSVRGILHKIHAAIIFTLIYIYFPVAEILYLIYNPDLENITLSLSFILSHIIGIVKIVLILIFRKKVDFFCKSIEAAPFLPDRNRSGDIEFTYVQRAISASNMQLYVFSGLVIFICAQKVYHSLHNDESFTNITYARNTRELPFNCVVPFSTKDNFGYAIAATFSVASPLVFGFAIGAIDALICGIMCHIKSQLLIVQSCLHSYISRAVYLMEEEGKQFPNNEQKVLNRFSDDSDQVQKVPPLLQKHVTVCVNEIIAHHQKIFHLADGAEDTFSLLMLNQFCFSLLIICFVLFQLSILEIVSVPFISLACYAALMSFQIYLFCYRGNEVMLESSNIPYAVFESNWIITDLKTQKSLLIMMMRGYRPIKMTAGKFVFLSLESFISILRGAGSYFMVLKNANDPPE